MSYTKPQALDEQTFYLVIADHYARYIQGDKTRIRYTVHGEERRDEAKRNMSHDKVLDIIKRPKRMSKEPEWSDKHKSWKYRIQGFNKREIVITISKGYIDIVTTF